MSRLVVDAAAALTDIVEALHVEIARRASVPDTPVHAAVRGITRGAYQGVRAVTHLVGEGLDAGLGVLPSPSAGSSRERDIALGVLNGVLGDHLAASGNPLALPMRLFGEAVKGDAPDGAPVLVLVHGLCMSARQWERDGRDRVAELGRELGFVVLHLEYNSGRHVSENGRAFADLLQDLVTRWRGAVPELSIVGHSMGGLVTRSAFHYGTAAGHGWPAQVRKVIFLGTPHHGSPVERGGNWIEAVLGSSALSAPFARLGRLRSAGVTDLRYGNLLDEDWDGHDRFARGADRRRPLPLSPAVAWYAVAATKRKDAGGDGLVTVDSALGRHPDRRRSLRIPPTRRAVLGGTTHLGLLSSPEVLARLRDWLSSNP